MGKGFANLIKVNLAGKICIAAAVAAAVALVLWFLKPSGHPGASIPKPCYNHGPEACESITADEKMSAYTGLQVTAACTTKRFGHEGDGGFFACVDESGPLDGHTRFLGQHRDTPCLVYSFGIRDDWTFDVAMRDAGCDVHSFDPTIGSPAACWYNSDTRPKGCQPKGIAFHPIGLGAKDGEQLLVDEDSAAHGGAGKLLTLAAIRKSLGHGARQLTVLKFDIEGSEWPILKQIAAASKAGEFDVGQILTEIHYWGAACDRSQKKWYERRRRHELDEANVPDDQWYNVCQHDPPDLSEMAVYHDAVMAMRGADFAFGRIDVNHWSTIMKGLRAKHAEQAPEFGMLHGKDTQCCYEAIIIKQ